MLCYQCDEQARGVCIFCGRAVCKKHTKKMPAIISIYVGEGNVPKAVKLLPILKPAYELYPRYLEQRGLERLIA